MLKISFTQQEGCNKNQWTMQLLSDGKEPKTIVDLNLETISIINKFEVIKDLFENISEMVGNEFVFWYVNMITKYIKSNYNSEVFLEEVPNFLHFAELYIDKKDINFSNFVNHSKASKTSILFDEDDLRAIAKTSVCLKLYSPIAYDQALKLTENTNKLIFTSFIQECINLGTTEKIFQVMRSRTYRSSMTDKYMWDLIRMVVTETPENYTLLMFNFLLSNMISTLDIEKNPIPFFISVIDDSLRWTMSNIYKDRVIYGEVFGGPGDIYGSMLTKETLNIYCCNDVVGKAAKVGMELLEKEYGATEEKFEDVRDRLDEIKYVSPIMQNIVLPIANKVLEIPYNYLLTAPPKHIALIGVLMHYCSIGILDERFPIFHELLLSVPKDQINKINNSSYKIKDITSVVNEKNLLFGLNSPTLRFHVISKICGILSMSKKSHVSLITGKKVKKMNFQSLESDVLQFYSELYSNKLDSSFIRMRDEVDQLL